MNEVRHIGIVVQNLRKVSFFFINELNFRVYRQLNEDSKFIDKTLGLKKTKLTTLKLKSSNDCLVELLKFHNYKNKINYKSKIYHSGITHIALTVKNINNLFNKLKKKYKFISEPIISNDKKAKVAFLHGPENLILELVEVL